MRRSCALVAVLALAGCRPFQPGLPDIYDAAIYDVPPDVATDSPPPPGTSVDASAAEVQRDEPLPPGPPADIGCADGTREGFISRDDWRNIAGCAGAWSVPGLLSANARQPACERAAGNDGVNAAGLGCTVTDLCAVGWHVCSDAGEVARSSPSGCESAVADGQPLFFLVLAGASPQGICSPDRDAQDDLHGCGTLGESESPSCDPLDRRLTFAECQASHGVWSCGDASQHLAEAAVVSKRAPALGGVLCCRDE